MSKYDTISSNLRFINEPDITISFGENSKIKRNNSSRGGVIFFLSLHAISIILDCAVERSRIEIPIIEWEQASSK